MQSMSFVIFFCGGLLVFIRLVIHVSWCVSDIRNTPAPKLKWQKLKFSCILTRTFITCSIGSKNFKDCSHNTFYDFVIH